MNVTQARAKLKRGGWSYRSAAAALGTSSSWLGRVLTGKQVSQPLLDGIAALPTFAEWRQTRDEQSAT
jgi:hypothetical protein